MTASPASAISRLEGIVGATNAAADPAALAAYEVDGMRPGVAARPGTAEEAAEVVRYAAAEKLAVIACGARTKLGIGGIPARYDIAVDVSRLNRILAYDPGDLTLSVEAGIRLADLGEELSRHQQMLPLAVPYTSQTTAGGTLASGVDSPLRQYYGTARDYLLGVEFVDGTGVRTKSGARVVKNVAGYDIHKLHLGALGTLGILTQLNFRTFPIIYSGSRGFLATFPDFRSALELRHRIAKSPLQPYTLEILSPEVTRMFAERAPRTLGQTLGPPGAWLSTTQWTLAAGFGGKPAVLDRNEEELQRLAKETGAANPVVLSDEERPLVWGRLRECFPMLLESSRATTILRINVLPGQLGDAQDAVRQAAARGRVATATVARGVGVLYAALLPETDAPETLRQVARVCTEIRETVEKMRGHATAPWCPTAIKRGWDVWGAPRGDFELMKKVKGAFDPHGILAPGRFVGGI